MTTRAGYRARFAARTAEDDARRCQEHYPPPADELAAQAAKSAKQIAGSTVAEWTALFDYKLAADQAFGFAALKAEFCATLPSTSASPSTAPQRQRRASLLSSLLE